MALETAWLRIQSEVQPKVEQQDEGKQQQRLPGLVEGRKAGEQAGREQGRACKTGRPPLDHSNNNSPAAAPLTAVQKPGSLPVQKRKRGCSTRERACKIPATPAGKRSSIYRGVTRHRWTGRYEAHLWDKNTWNQTQNKKGKQVYLGAYDDEDAAARAYDLAALKYWGPGTIINFPVADYATEIEEMQNVTREEYLACLRRKSSGFSRGVSKYRGVARHHHNGRWEARIGRVFGNKYLYLGTYSTQEEAAAAYDMAAIEYRGLNAVTNFDLSRYIRWLRPGNGVIPGSEANAAATSSVDDLLKQQQQHQQEQEQEKQQQQQKPQQQQSIPRQVWPTTNIPDLYQQQQQQQQQQKTSKQADTQTCGNGNPTALSLLLQSSMFRQMVEKTSSSAFHIDDGQQYFVDASEEATSSSIYSDEGSGGIGYYHDEQQQQQQQQPETFDFLEHENLTHSNGDDCDVDHQELSLWSQFESSSLSTLPLANGIGC